MSERPLPLVEAPVALASPRVARLLVSVWDRAVAPALRLSAEPVPDELADFVAACRAVAGCGASAGGTDVDNGAEAGAGSADGATRDWRSTAEAACRLGVSDRRVRQLCATEELTSKKFGQSWLVDGAAVESRRAQRAVSA